ncbi:MAG: DUF1684 domain-containing protein [Rhodoferax sp.]|jgi:hypothetical protein|nr:DUF1684 domain-containing protein [Rhodoferax sp.]
MTTTTETAQQAQQAWHQERLRALQAPDGWLTLAGLIWLEDGLHTIGPAADCALQLPGAGRCPDRWGRLQIQGLTAVWHDADGSTRPLQPNATGPDDIVQKGPVSFMVLARDGALALRIKDSAADTRTGFQGTTLFPFNPALQIPAHWDGAQAHCDIDGRHYALRPQNAEADPLHFVIGDATSGSLSYGGGRFLYVPRASRAPGPILLDLNRCINPPCAFTRYALCPVPPPENRLHVAVLAGETNYGDHA